MKNTWLLRQSRLVAGSLATLALLAACGGNSLQGNSGTSQPTATALLPLTSPGASLSLFASSIGGSGSVDGTGSSARFTAAAFSATDSSGNVYISDTGNNTIRKVTPAGVVTTLAGKAGVSGSTDGTGSAARFNSPEGIAVDSSGNIFVVDSANGTIRKVTSAGVVTTLAGTAGTSGSADGTGGAASFDYPRGVGIDSSNNLFVADTFNSSIRKITPAGVVTTFASGPTFNGPWAVAVNSTGDLYVTDAYNQIVIKITSAGVVSTIAGTASATGSIDGTGAAARFNYPQGIAVDGSGHIYVSDTGNATLRVIDSSTYAVTTLAGSAGTIGSTDGTGSAARFYWPVGSATDSSGNVYVLDSAFNTLRKVTSSGVTSTVAGLAPTTGTADGTTTTATFSGASHYAVDSSGNVFVTDTGGCTIRKIDTSGNVTTLAGSAGNCGTTDGTGSGAAFNYPEGITIDGSGNLYVADTSNSTIRKVTSAGVVTTIGGIAGNSGFTDGSASVSQFSYPYAVAADSAGNVYVADTYNNAIRKISTTGTVSTVTSGGLAYPQGIAVDSSGVIYVADTQNAVIKVYASGSLTTLAGNAGVQAFADGTGTAAEFNYPASLALDGSGNLYVADTFNHVIRKIVTSTGVTSTIIGVAGQGGDLEGSLPGLIALPVGIALTPSGDMILNSDNAILKATGF